jgi:hypothetical protein
MKKFFTLRDKAFVAGARSAAEMASQYNASTSHPYRLDDCILSKLNIRRAKPRKNKTCRRDEWICGYAAALAVFVRMFHFSSSALSVMRGDNFTIEKFAKAGVEPFDLKELRKLRRARSWR